MTTERQSAMQAMLRALLGLFGVALLPLALGCEGTFVETLPGIDALVRGPRKRLGELTDNVAEWPAELARRRVRAAEHATTRLDVEQAAILLEGTTGPEAQRAKARLALYRADCAQALSLLSTEVARRAEDTRELYAVAEKCHGATAGGKVIEDVERGLWFRVQDEADLVLVPFLARVLVDARERLGRDLGVELPRPLRLDLVRDLFSLSAVSGLPLDAAETTGTVAVARWGRVTMLSPRAPREGYPWADTLAHELTHLMLSRATSDRAPLWLQEGVAKLSEERWRAAWPFDKTPDPARVAFDAEQTGERVGVTKLGPSIAMLPSARAASIAFSEVRSFMEFWIEANGRPALRLLLEELSVTEDADSAMRSVSGLGVAEWELLFRASLAERFAGVAEEEASPTESQKRPSPGTAVWREARLVELLDVSGFANEAAERGAPLVDQAPHLAALRFLVARAARPARRDDADELLGGLADVEDAHGGWLALRASAPAAAPGDTPKFDSGVLFEQARALDPLLLEAVCLAADQPGAAADPDLNKLCEHVRGLPRRGTR